MEFRSLKYLLSLHETGSFTAAARANFVTQPAVSIRLRKLGEELGVTLFELDGRRVRFTREGEAVLAYARRFYGLEQELLAEIRDRRSLRKGSLALGVIDAASTYVMPGVFSRFHECHPGVDVRIEIASTKPLLERLRAGGLDLVIGTLPVDEDTGLEVIPVYRERLIVIAPAGHPLASMRRVTAKQLAGHRFISFHPESVTRRIVEDIFRERGLEMRITMAIGSPEAIKNLVAAGLGLAVLPEGIVGDEARDGTLVPLETRGLKLERKLGLILPSGRYLSSTVRAFLAIMREKLGVRLPARYCDMRAGSPERG